MTEYELLNPSGNVTALVTKDVPREKYKEISNEIMNSNPNVEQVGFLKKYSDTVFRLEMAGLEFCGNASRAFACFLVKEKYVSSNKFEISVSGYNDLIECNVEKKGNEFFSTIDLKLKKPIRND
jgi:diaminopimelate epimerase